jgi:hypothetical protein
MKRATGRVTGLGARFSLITIFLILEGPLLTGSGPLCMNGLLPAAPMILITSFSRLP